MKSQNSHKRVLIVVYRYLYASYMNNVMPSAKKGGENDAFMCGAYKICLSNDLQCLSV